MKFRVMKKVHIFYNSLKPEAQQTATELNEIFKRNNINSKFAETEKSSEDWLEVDNDTDMLIVLGGDGTFLKAAPQVLSRSIPILGVNFGHLGFLSEFGDMPMQELTNIILNGDYIIEERSTLSAYIEDRNEYYYAINDITLNRSHYTNLLHTDIYIGDDLLHSLRADGLIISTPTGSTAYAISAGGAVMDPNISAFQIVPIAPHSLNSRPHVVSDSSIIKLESQDYMNFFLHADGRDLVELKAKSRVIVKKSPYTLKLVKLNIKGRSFYSVLREKLQWSCAAVSKRG